VIAGYHIFYEHMELSVYTGLTALTIASVWLVIENKRCATCEAANDKPARAAWLGSLACIA